MLNQTWSIVCHVAPTHAICDIPPCIGRLTNHASAAFIERNGAILFSEVPHLHGMRFGDVALPGAPLECVAGCMNGGVHLFGSYIDALE